MTPEQQTVADILAHIETLPHKWMKVAVREAANDLRWWVTTKGEIGRLALVLVGAELAVQVKQ